MVTGHLTDISGSGTCSLHQCKFGGGCSGDGNGDGTCKRTLTCPSNFIVICLRDKTPAVQDLIQQKIRLIQKALLYHTQLPPRDWQAFSKLEITLSRWECSVDFNPLGPGAHNKKTETYLIGFNVRRCGEKVNVFLGK